MNGRGECGDRYLGVIHGVRGLIGGDCEGMYVYNDHPSFLLFHIPGGSHILSFLMDSPALGCDKSMCLRFNNIFINKYIIKTNHNMSENYTIRRR